MRLPQPSGAHGTSLASPGCVPSQEGVEAGTGWGGHGAQTLGGVSRPQNAIVRAQSTQQQLPPPRGGQRECRWARALRSALGWDEAEGTGGLQEELGGGGSQGAPGLGRQLP